MFFFLCVVSHITNNEEFYRFSLNFTEQYKLIKQGYVLHFPSKRKRDEKEEVGDQNGNITATTILFKPKEIFCKKMGYRANQFLT